MKERIKLRIVCMLYDWMKKLFKKDNSLDLTIHTIEERSIDLSIWEERKDVHVGGKCFHRIKSYDVPMFDITIFTKREED